MGRVVVGSGGKGGGVGASGRDEQPIDPFFGNPRYSKRAITKND